MFGFGRRNKAQQPGATTDTFVEATGGGWSDIPSRVAGDGGAQADYVGKMLQRAKLKSQSVAVGEEFDFTITDIPRDIASPHEIMFGMMMRASSYGLDLIVMHDETGTFVRLS